MDQINFAKDLAVNNMEMFLRNFAHVPDEKLNWTPSQTSKSALRIGAHVAVFAKVFAQMIREQKAPPSHDIDVWRAERDAEEMAVTKRAQMERLLREGTADVVTALDALDPAVLDSSIDSGQGWSIPMSQLILLPGWHATLHAGQIDFIQTCYGDQEIYLR